ALIVAVRPVGVQGDGPLIEGANVPASGFSGNAVVGREHPDLSPDFVYQSRGRVTDWGYEVEVRIPFKSIRYQARQPQDWKLNIVREVQHSGFEDCWFRARRASATFIGPWGSLVGVSGMHRGLGLAVNPAATATAVGTDIGLLSAVDQKFASVTGSDNPIFNILRAQRSLGRGSRVGLAYTDRIEGGDYDRVAEVDSRLVFKEIYGLNLQLAGSRTRVGGVTTTAPLWLSQFTVQDRIWGLRSLFAGIGDDFRDASGFIGRAGIVHAYVDPSYTTYGRPGALLQRFTGDIVVDGIWQYQNFIHGRHLQDKKLHFNGNATLRGGWNVGAGYFVESFGYDSALYANYRLKLPNGSVVQFTGQPTIANGEYIVQIGTPQWKHFSGNGYFLQGHDENFFEWASGDSWLLSVDLSYRPTERLRNSISYFWQQVNRRTDGSLVNVGRVLQAKIEYQLSRPLFVRVVGQYIQDKTDS